MENIKNGVDLDIFQKQTQTNTRGIIYSKCTCSTYHITRRGKKVKDLCSHVWIDNGVIVKRVAA